MSRYHIENLRFNEDDCRVIKAFLQRRGIRQKDIAQMINSSDNTVSVALNGGSIGVATYYALLAALGRLRETSVATVQ